MFGTEHRRSSSSDAKPRLTKQFKKIRAPVRHQHLDEDVLIRGFLAGKSSLVCGPTPALTSEFAAVHAMRPGDSFETPQRPARYCKCCRSG